MVNIKSLTAFETTSVQMTWKLAIVGHCPAFNNEKNLYHIQSAIKGLTRKRSTNLDKKTKGLISTNQFKRGKTNITDTNQ